MTWCEYISELSNLFDVFISDLQNSSWKLTARTCLKVASEDVPSSLEECMQNFDFKIANINNVWCSQAFIRTQSFNVCNFIQETSNVLIIVNTNVTGSEIQ